MDFEGIEVHEAANLFPMEEETIDELAQDIIKNGQHETIKLFEGKLIDGRRRLKACEKVGIDPMAEEIETDDPISYVLSLNLHRRHLTTSQRAMIAARVREYYDEEAKKRQLTGLKWNRNAISAKLQEQRKGQSRDLAGRDFKVGGRSVDHARKVLTQGIPELIKAVNEGRIAVSSAAVLALEPPETQKKQIEGQKKIYGNRSISSLENNAFFYTKLAVADLECIRADDPNRYEALSWVIDWCEQQIKGGAN